MSYIGEEQRVYLATWQKPRLNYTSIHICTCWDVGGQKSQPETRWRSQSPPAGRFSCPDITCSCRQEQRVVILELTNYSAWIWSWGRGETSRIWGCTTTQPMDSGFICPAIYSCLLIIDRQTCLPTYLPMYTHTHSHYWNTLYTL